MAERALSCWRVKWVDAGLMKLASSSQVSCGPKPGLSHGPSGPQQDEHGTGDGALMACCGARAFGLSLLERRAALGVDGTPPSTAGTLTYKSL